MFIRKFTVLAVVLLFSNTIANDKWLISIKGAKVYSESFLIERLDLPQEMDIISPERRDFIIKLSKGNLEDFYQNNGYFSAKVNITTTEDIKDSSKIQNYLFEVEEGERYEFRNARVTIAPNSDSLELTKSLNILDGGFYNADKIIYDLRLIREVYQKNGYLHIHVEHLEYIDTTYKKVDVEYFVNSRNQVRMGTFKTVVYRSGYLPGQTHLEVGLSDTAWISKLWEIQKDSIIDGRYYNSFRTKLFSTQLFSQIQLEDTLRSDKLSDITLTAYERIPGEANYGFFFEQIYGVGVTYSYKYRNFFGSFHEGGISTFVAQNKQEISLNYANPLLFGVSFPELYTAIRFDNRLYFNHEELPDPVTPDVLRERWEIVNRGDLSFGLTSKIRSRWTLDFRYLQLQTEKKYKVKGETGLIFDFTDNSYEPTFGIRISPNVGAGTELPSFDVIEFEHFFRYFDGTVALYYPLSRRLHSAFAFSSGIVFHNAAREDAELFYQGGGRTLRGYGFRTVFPYKYFDDAKSDSIIGGSSPRYFRANEELRLNLPLRFQFVQFVDWARIEDSDASFKSNSQASFGFGLRYRWQFLTIRLDYALKTTFKDWKPEKFDWSRIVFDLSQAF